MPKRARFLAIVRRPLGLLGVRGPDALVVRDQTERALRVSDPEAEELAQGLRRGSSGELWSAVEAAQALAGAQNTRELLAVTKEILPIQVEPAAAGLSSIDRPKTWRELLKEHPPDNVLPEDTTEP